METHVVDISHKTTDSLNLGELRFDLTTKQIWFEGTRLPISASLFEILYELARAEGQIVSRDELLKLRANLALDGTLSTRVNRLRNFLKRWHVDFIRISTVYKVGYCLMRVD